MFVWTNRKKSKEFRTLFTEKFANDIILQSVFSYSYLLPSEWKGPSDFVHFIGSREFGAESLGIWFLFYQTENLNIMNQMPNEITRQITPNLMALAQNSFGFIHSICRSRLYFISVFSLFIYAITTNEHFFISNTSDDSNDGRKKKK